MPRNHDARRHTRLFAFSLPAALLILCMQPALAAAELRGLTIGIDRYDHQPDLAGSVNDARVIAAALRRAGARSVTVLTDRQATYEAIRAAWDALVARAKRGDTFVLSYAGHGGQTPEQVRDSELDGRDENFFLSGYRKDDPRAARERIVDNEMFLWLKRASDKGVRVIFIADSCHSGTMTRSLDGRAGLSVRSLPYGEPEDDVALFPDTGEGARLGLEDLANVTFFAAAQEDKKIAEVVVEGQERGALSWAFSRTIGAGRGGGADRNGDGVLTRFEVESFVLGAVANLADHAQEVDVLPRLRSGDGDGADADAPLIELAGKGGDGGDTAPPLSLRIANMGADDARRLAGQLSGVRYVGDPGASADLVWDTRDGAVVNGRGDVVALDVRAAALQGVADKWRALAELKRVALGRGLATRLSPDESRHPEGRILGLESDPVPHPNLLLLNLEPAGRVAPLYPYHKNESTRWRVGEPFRLSDIVVQPPFGADHMVFITSDGPLDDLLARARRAGAAALPDLVRRALAGRSYRIGLHGVHTRKGEGKE